MASTESLGPHEQPAPSHSNCIILSQIEETYPNPAPALPAMAFRQLWL